MTAVEDASLPARLGRYEILGRIATGGFCEILLGRASGRRGFRRTVALKRLREGLEGDARLQRLLVQEARIAASLDHPNIVQTYGLERVEGPGGAVPVLVMERVSGADLARVGAALRAQRRAMPRGLALFCGFRLLRALAAVHESRDRQGRPLGLVHADVSPQNLLLSVQGQVKLADFGQARLLAVKSEAEAPRGGKRPWQAPEIRAGAAPSPAGDVWAAGRLLWELLAAERPPEPSPGLPHPPVPGLPAPLQALLDELLAEDPARRPPAAEAERRLKALAIEAGHREGPSELGALVQALLPEVVELRPDAIDLAALAADLAATGRVPADRGGSGRASSTEAGRRATGQVRAVVVLVVEMRVVGASRADLDVEVEARLRLRALRRLRRVLMAHGGWLDRVEDGRATAFFGLPRAGERDLDEAFAAALALRAERVGAHEGRPLLRFALGLHRGELAILRLEEGPRRRLRHLPRGETTRLPLRLCLRAAPGQVLVSGELRERARDRFDFLAGPPMEHEPQGARSWVLRRGQPGLPVPAGPWVPRGPEYPALARALRRVAAGAAVRLLIQGPAGSGKSRLVAELQGLAEQRGIRLFATRAPRSRRPHSLAALLELHRQLQAERPAPGAEPPPADEAPADPPVGMASSGSIPAEAAARLSQALRRRAADGPLILALEDAEDLSPDELHALDLLLPRLRDLPLLLLVTARGAPPAALQPFDERVRLEPLSGRVLHDVLAQALDARVVDPALCLALEGASEGNPRALVGLARALRQAEAIVVEEGRARQARPLHLGEGGAALDELLGARIDALPPESLAALRAGAVLGASFPRGRLRALLGDREDEALAPLLEGGLLTRDGELVRFPSELLHERVIRGIDGADRRALHAQVAAVLEREGTPDAEALALRAEHLARAGEVARAASLAREAGQRRLARGDGPGASRLWLRAIGWLQRAGRAGLPPSVGGDEEARLLLALGEEAARSGRGEAALRMLRAAFDVAAEREDRRLQARCLLEIGRLLRGTGAGRPLVLAHFEAVVQAVAADDDEEARALRQGARDALAALGPEPDGRERDGPSTSRVW